MTAGQHIDYDALALEALRGVVKACLAQVARTGLVGDHHFYIAFNTQAPGVGMSKRLKEKYPVEMTIVLQHRFWDLAVEDDRFEVKLTFDGVPERLIIPFKAVKVFYDPSVPYGLQFEEAEASAGPDVARRGTRRGVGFARDAELRPIAGAAGSRAPTDERQDGEADETAADRGDRRRPGRRTRFERTGEPRPIDARTAETRPRPVEKAPAPPPAASVPAQPSKPVAPVPAPARPAAVIAVAKGDDGAKKPDAAEDKSASGAKIFDLSKFRGKK
jgi:hypothetical protein